MEPRERRRSGEAKHLAVQSWRQFGQDICLSKGIAMQMVKIQIPERSDRVKSLVELARRGRVICLPEDVFVVPEPALELLRSLGVSYLELGRGGFDYAEKANGSMAESGTPMLAGLLTSLPLTLAVVAGTVLQGW